MLAEHDRPTRTSRPSSSSTSPDIAGAANDAGPVGRGGRLLLRRAAARRRRRDVPLQGALDGRPAAAAPRRTTLGTATLDRLPDFAGRLRWFLAQPARVRRASSAHAHDPRRAAAAGCCRWSARTGCVRMLARDARRGRVPVAATACGRCRARHRDAAVHASTLGGIDVTRRLRAGRVDHRPVRRQLQLARPDLVPGQLPADRGAARLRRVLRRRPARSSTRPAPGSKLHARRRSPTTSSGRLVSLFLPRRGRPAAGATAAYELFQTDPRLAATCIPFHEYFHGDTGAGPGRLRTRPAGRRWSPT